MSIKKNCLLIVVILCLISTLFSCSNLMVKLENTRKKSTGPFTYTVKHFQQNITDDEYTEITEDEETLSGKAGELTKAQPKEYKGFTAKEITQQSIARDGSTVVGVYYDRNSYTVSFDTNWAGCYSDITVRAGTKIARPVDPQKNMHTFLGWCKDSDTTEPFDFENTEIFEDITIYAKWYTLVGTVAKAAIEIDGKAFDKTEEVYVVPPGEVAVIECGEIHPDLTSFHRSYIYHFGVFWDNRKIKLSPYIISKYEVTRELYEEIMKDQTFSIKVGRYNYTGYLDTNPSFFTEGDEIKTYYPVDYISKYDAIYFCNLLSEKQGLEPVYELKNIKIELRSIEGSRPTQAELKKGYIQSANVTYNLSANGYRLPTQAEWEFAARGGDPARPEWNYLYSGSPSAEGVDHTDRYAIDDGIDEVGWYYYNCKDDPVSGPHEVGLKKPNSLGLYDMTGNAWEYCNDQYPGNINDLLSGKDDEGYLINPRGGSRGSNFLLGGAFNSYACNSTVCYLHTVNTGYTDVWNGRTAFGLRLVRSCPQE